jgi:hypothetical protein
MNGAHPVSIPCDDPKVDSDCSPALLASQPFPEVGNVKEGTRCPLPRS